MPISTLLGPIVRLQIARFRLRARDEHQTYTPQALMTPDDFVLTTNGVIGRTSDGWLLDRHHTDHPDNESAEPGRALSVGFTGHYAAMADRFGPVDLGAAGENVIVETDSLVTLDRIAGGLEIRSRGRRMDLGRPVIAEPCVYFTRFMLGGGDQVPEAMKNGRRFLRNGMRGYVVGLTSLQETVAIEVGDELWAVPAA